MAVGLRGYTQGSIANIGTSVSWPAGSAAGDLALVHCGGSYPNNGPQTSGWTPCGHKSYWKILTSTDIATALVVNASHVKLQVFTGAKSIGRTSTQNGLTVQGAGSYLYVESARAQSSIAPATHRLGVEWQDENGYYQAAYALASGAGWAAVPSMGSGATSYSYEVLPATAPSAPILTTPDAGASVDQTLALTFGWDHQSSFAQTGRRVRLTTGATIRWVDGAGALQATEQSVATASTTATLNAAALTAGAPYTWAAATQDTNGWSVYSAERALNPIAPPTISSVTVSSPADDLSPTVTWAATAGSGVLTAHQVWICNAADADPTVAPLWTTGVLANTVSPDTAPATVAWTNGASLKAWARVWQTGGVSRTLSSAAFTVSWTPPATPTVTASSATTPPTVSVSGLTAGNVVEVEQRLDGVTWTPLTTRVAAGASLAGIPSPLAATGTSVSFRARQATTVDGVLMQSAWSALASITATPAGCYVVDDGDRSVYLDASLESDGPREIVQSISVTYGLGASAARVDRTPEAGERGTVVWVTTTAAERDALLAWLDARPVFWIVFPPEDGLATAAKRVARTTPRSWERLAQVAIPHRLIPMSWVEQP
jgi:hypothetical protein